MATSLSLDCPRCHQLCLGPSLWPCGHVTCRMCLRQSLSCRQWSVDCPTCQKTVQLPSTIETVTEFLLLFPLDVAMEAVVEEELVNRGALKCKICKVPDAISLCLDCREAYCPACSSAHEGMGMSSDHKLYELPNFHEHAVDVEGLSLAVVANPSDDGTTSSVVSSAPSDEEAGATGGATGHHHQHQQHQQREQEELQRWMSIQTESLQEDIAALTAVVDDSQDLTKLAQKGMRFLSSYQRHLPRFDITCQQRDIVDRRLQHIREEARSSMSTRLVSFMQIAARANITRTRTSSTQAHEQDNVHNETQKNTKTQTRTPNKATDPRTKTSTVTLSTSPWSRLQAENMTNTRAANTQFHRRDNRPTHNVTQVNRNTQTQTSTPDKANDKNLSDVHVRTSSIPRSESSCSYPQDVWIDSLCLTGYLHWQNLMEIPLQRVPGIGADVLMEGCLLVHVPRACLWCGVYAVVTSSQILFYETQKNIKDHALCRVLNIDEVVHAGPATQDDGYIAGAKDIPKMFWIWYTTKEDNAAGLDCDRAGRISYMGHNFFDLRSGTPTSLDCCDKSDSDRPVFYPVAVVQCKRCHITVNEEDIGKGFLDCCKGNKVLFHAHTADEQKAWITHISKMSKQGVVDEET